jgi:hypothetical protein
VSLRPDGTRTLSPADRDRLAHVQQVLTANPTARVTVDPIPETLAALSALATPGSPTPDSLRAAIAARPVLASTLVDVDVDQWLAAGLRDQLERQRQLALDALANDKVLHTNPAPDGATWVVRHPLGPTSRSELQSLDAPPVTRLVVPSGAVGPVEARGLSAGDALDAGLQPFDIAHPGGATRAVLADERLAGRLVATDNAIVNSQAALADLAILACGSKSANHCNGLPRNGRGVAMVVPDDVRAIDALDRVLRSLTGGTPIVQLADVGGLFMLPAATAPRSATPVVRTYTTPAPPSGGGLGDYPRQLDETATRVGAYRSMLVPPPPDPATDASPIPDPGETTPTDRADRLFQRLDVAAATNGVAPPSAYVDEVGRQTAAVFDAIQAPAHEPITLTSTDGEIQVVLENDLDHPVTVEVQLSSDKPLFEAGARFTTVMHQLPPKSTSSSVRVRVHAVGSGSFPVDVRVLSPDERTVLRSTRIEVRSTVVSGLGLALTVAAGVFLLVWWGRHFRDARRARKLVDVDEVEQAVAMATGEVPAIR